MASHIVQLLKNLLTEQSEGIENWFSRQYAQTPPYFATSVDIRHSGDKLAPVDTNLFPAGFNNLSEKARQRSIELARQDIKPGQRILVVPEEHTRNLKYLDSLAVLCDILRQAGAEVAVATVDQTITQTLALTSASGDEILESPLKQEGGILRTIEGFTPDLVLMNHDLTGGVPPVLKGIHQPIMPPLSMGWYRRRKSEHFRCYQELVNAFAREFGINPWRLQAEFTSCGKIDFWEMQGVECVALAVEKLIHRLTEDYRQYGISGSPMVFIKSDAGTYGMGIMTARSADEVMEMNRKNRKKMQVIKGGVENNEVIVQEGIPTIDKVEGQVAEPMLYLIRGQPVGGAYRVHAERGIDQSLNAVGMRFAPLCAPGEGNPYPEACDFQVLGLIGRLAALAAAREYSEIKEAA